MRLLLDAFLAEHANTSHRCREHPQVGSKGSPASLSNNRYTKSAFCSFQVMRLRLRERAQQHDHRSPRETLSLPYMI